MEAELIQLAADKEWLHKFTKEIAKHWRHKRERRMNPLPLRRSDKREGINFHTKKVSPNSSPEEQLVGDKEVVESGKGVVSESD